MSRVGKMPVTIPAGVDVSVKDDQISVKGTGGALSLAQNALVKVSSNDGKLSFEPANESREANAMSGTIRQLVNNMVVGVSKGFEKKLSLVGVGYKAAASGSKLNLAVGYSHPVNIEMPAGITVATPTPTEVVIKGADRQRVGQVVADDDPLHLRPGEEGEQGRETEREQDEEAASEDHRGTSTDARISSITRSGVNPSSSASERSSRRWRSTGWMTSRISSGVE